MKFKSPRVDVDLTKLNTIKWKRLELISDEYNDEELHDVINNFITNAIPHNIKLVLIILYLYYLIIKFVYISYLLKYNFY